MSTKSGSDHTIHGNTGTSGSGGGLYNAIGTMGIVNSTVSNNAGGGIQNDDEEVYLTNTIVANNTAGGDCSGFGTWNSGDAANLDSDGTCPGFTKSGDPLLGPLQDNGGFTWTQALLDGSPAIDAGSNAPCPETDQRGLRRPGDGDDDGQADCDLGAYELGAQWTHFLPMISGP